MKKTVITFGVIAGILVVALMALTMPIGKEQMDFDKGEMLGYLSMIIALSAIFFGIKVYRDKKSGGTITFKRGFLIGLYITLIAGLFYIVGWEIYYQNNGAGFAEAYTQHMVNKMAEKGMSQSQIDKEVANMQQMWEYYKNPLVRWGMTLMEILPVGLIISLISALLLRKRNVFPSHDNTAATT